jgi:hypothetical protein
MQLGSGGIMCGLFAEEVRSNVNPSHTTIKLENAGTVLSYVNDPDVGNIGPPVKLIV